ncbi:DNA-3-methyladenine glycosylase 2 family protein [Candidatus Parcubacteria bacterium]|nr:DNA-3-methyladenine glycosylase 2 family protein [Candidatus Parcubacteria bacterium]
MIKLEKHKLKRKLVPSENHFLSLTRSIIYQQISTKAGNAINGRFLALFCRRKITPRNLLKLSDKDLRGAGLSGQKVTYLRDLAQKFEDKTFSNSQEHWNRLSDEEVKANLVQVRGIGSWTADMFLIFALNRPNVLPVGDLGIKKGFQKVFKLRKLPDEKRMRKLAKEFEGEHSYLALFLWQSIDDAEEGW